MDTINSRVMFQVSLKHFWTDNQLAWDPAKYGGIEKIRIPTDPEAADAAIWVPDLHIYELGTSFMYESLLRPNAQVSSDGSVYWSTPGQMYINSNFDLFYYPFDLQKLTLIMEPWTYTADQVKLVVYDPPIGVAQDFYQPHVEWELVAYNSSYNIFTYESGSFSVANYELFIVRTGSTLLITVLIPGVSITLLSMMYFYIPLGGGERVPYLSTILLTSVMFLVMLTQFIPLARDVPLFEMMFLLLSVY